MVFPFYLHIIDYIFDICMFDVSCNFFSYTCLIGASSSDRSKSETFMFSCEHSCAEAGFKERSGQTPELSNIASTK